MSRSGTAEEPKLFTLHPIPVCLLFTLVALIPATLTLSQPQGQLCLLFSLSGPKKTCLYPFFEPRSTSLRKANSYMQLESGLLCRESSQTFIQDQSGDNPSPGGLRNFTKVQFKATIVGEVKMDSREGFCSLGPQLG